MIDLIANEFKNENKEPTLNKYSNDLLLTKYLIKHKRNFLIKI